MKKSGLLALLVLCVISWASFGQNPDNRFKMVGQNAQSILINQTYSETVEILPFGQIGKPIYGLDATADITLNGENSLIRLVLIDNNFNEYLIYESYNLLLEAEKSFSIKDICEETSILDGVKPYSLQIEIENAQLKLKSLSYSTSIDSGLDVEQAKKEKKQGQNEVKINKINKNLKEKGKHWVAGPTNVSELSYGQRKKLYGQSTFPAGFEYYAGGVITAGSTESTSTSDVILKSATTTSSPYVDYWDWRDRHAKNWITPVTDQQTCGSCWAFASTGATEAMVNVYFNQQLNLDLSEQDLVSCSNAGDCIGGVPQYALDYIARSGIVDEVTFPYSSSDQACTDKGTNPNELIKIKGKLQFGSIDYPKSEDLLKQWLIEKGPISGGLGDWNHTMVLVGYKIVKEGDVFFYSDPRGFDYTKTVTADDPLIGKLVWIFKNSWGADWGDEGYTYVETPITNMGWTCAIQTPITSEVNNYQVKCTDADGDGYYWWGLGEKPANCPPCPDLADGDDSDATKGPLDEYGYCMPLGGTAVPVANFTASKTAVNTNETVSFSDLSTNTPTSWSWTFAGGNPATSTAQNPTVTYSSAGTYKVTLTATNADGSNTKSVDNYITVTVPIVAPVADFSANPRSLEKGGNVTFSDLSSNSPTSWSWTFEGGNPATSTAQNPTVTYNTSGTYKVILTATNASGSDTKTAYNYIEVTEPVVLPVADFAANKTIISTGESVSFSDLSSNATARSWTFEGGSPTTSTAQNPAVTYYTAGTYKVTVTATNADGSDTKILDNYIAVNDPVTVVVPVADFAADKTIITTGKSVNFSDLSSDATSWSWTFEGADKTSSTLQNPSIIYSKAGTYNVSLTATNADGSDTKTSIDYIQVNEPILLPVANFSASQTSINTGESVSFSDQSSDATAWNWTFEEGTPGTSTAQNPTISYNAAGTYNVTLKAINADGSDTKTVTGYIQVNAPVLAPAVNFTADQTSITEGETVTFSDLSANEPTTWSWTFEGGTPGTSNQKNPTVTYATPGNYSVTLVASNSGGSDSKILDNYIQVDDYVPSYCIPTADASGQWIAGVEISGQSKISGSNGYTDFTSFIFDLERGTDQFIKLTPDFSPRSRFEYWAVWIDLNQNMAFEDSERLFISSKSKSAVSSTINIPAGENITTRMRVAMGSSEPTACDALTGEIEDYTVNLFVPAPVADFTVSSTNVAVGESVQFTNTSLYNPTSLSWDFGISTYASSSSIDPEPVVTYNSPGEYTVTLTVSNELGSSQKSEIITVYDQNTPVLDYCTPGNISTSANYIRNVIFAGTEVQSGANGYQLSGITFAEITPGQSSLTELDPLLRTTRNFWRIWIDFNQDGDFEDADETVFSLNNKKGTVSDYISIPTYASGSTRMRIAMKVGGVPAPCEDGFDGEVEDYVISFATPKASATSPFAESIIENTIAVYPNPAKDFINISIDEVGFEDSYSIYDLSGKALVQGQITSSFTRVDLSELPSGIYLLKVLNFDKLTVNKIIKKD
ncbi:PKD domain-containing protein [Draconibacterium halophilum]|nr:PKD domain-containing protein [Draconibacterium halophilum]